MIIIMMKMKIKIDKEKVNLYSEYNVDQMYKMIEDITKSANITKKDKDGFLKLWLNMIRKHPTIAVESYLISTLGYWYPNLKNSAYENTIIDNNIGL